MPQKQSQMFCPACNTTVLAAKSVPNHLVHALLTVFLCGLWLPVWVIVTAMSDVNDTWRCQRCGGSVLPLRKKRSPGVAGWVLIFACTVAFLILLAAVLTTLFMKVGTAP